MPSVWPVEPSIHQACPGNWCEPVAISIHRRWEPSTGAEPVLLGLIDGERRAMSPSFGQLTPSEASLLNGNGRISGRKDGVASALQLGPARGVVREAAYHAINWVVVVFLGDLSDVLVTSGRLPGLPHQVSRGCVPIVCDGNVSVNHHLHALVPEVQELGIVDIARQVLGRAPLDLARRSGQ